MLILADQQSQPVEQFDEVEVDLNPAYAQFRDQTRFWIQRVAVPLLMVIGLFGNSITMIIMTRRRMRSTTNMYLAALAFVDMLYLILTFLLGFSHYPNMASHKHYIYWKLKPFLMMLTDACSNTSVWLTVTFTIERYIAVKFPIKGKLWCTEARAKLLIISVFVFGILFAAPVPFEWQVVERKDHNINASGSETLHREVSEEKRTTLTLENTDFGRNETYKTIYYWSTAVIFYFIPLFSLMLFNGFLILSVHQSRKKRTRMTRRAMPSTISIPSPSCTVSPLEDESKPGHRRPNHLISDQNFSTDESLHQIDSGQCSPLIIVGAPDCEKESCRPYYPSSCKSNHHAGNNSGGDSIFSASGSTECDEQVEVKFQDAGEAKLALDSETMPLVSINGLAVSLGAQGGGQLEHATTKKPNANSSEDYELVEKKSNRAKASMNELNHGSAKITSSTAEGSSPARRPLGLCSNTGNNHQTMLAPASTQERRITIMLIAVVILFLICQIPSAAMLLYTSVREIAPNTNEHALVLAFGNIFNFLMAINAAGNFILYSLLSKKYRRTFVIIFCCCFGPKYVQKSINRMTSVKFETSGNVQKNQASFYHSVSGSERIRRDTHV